MNWKKIVEKIFLVFFVCICIGLGIHNFNTNSEFLKTPLSTIVTILIAVIVSYFLVQKKTDDRRKNEKIDKLLYKIQDIILEEDFLVAEKGSLIKQRSIVNKIQYLQENIDNKFENDVCRIREQFDILREFYSEHYQDEEYMKKSQNELMNYIRLVDDACDKIHMKLL